MQYCIIVLDSVKSFLRINQLEKENFFLGTGFPYYINIASDWTRLLIPLHSSNKRMGSDVYCVMIERRRYEYYIYYSYYIYQIQKVR